MPSKRVRLDEIYRRLTDALAPASTGEAFELMTRIMNAVEDELSGVDYDPTNWQNDGRLYPPLRDGVREVSGHPNVRRFRSRRHNTFISDNGAIEVQTTEGMVEFSKCGRDGKGIW